MAAGEEEEEGIVLMLLRLRFVGVAGAGTGTAATEASLAVELISGVGYGNLPVEEAGGGDEGGGAL